MDSSRTKELECPVCEADIPLEGGEQQGDMILCSYCKSPFKLLKQRGVWFLAEEFEE